MKNKGNILLLLILIVFINSCISTKSTLKNTNANAPIPKLSANNSFVLKEYSKDVKYGYDKDYPINVFYQNTKNDTLNEIRFLNALSGPKGEKISYKKIESCCPFPTKNTEMGAGFLDIYEITWEGQKTAIKLYLNIYEKGTLMVPLGFSLKK